MWLLLSLNIPILVLTFNSNFRFKYEPVEDKVYECKCNLTYEGPSFLPNDSFWPKPPLQCPQNIKNWTQVRRLLVATEYFLTHYCSIADPCRRVGKEDNLHKLTEESIFDYIVVGGGTAGSIVAGRLAADTDKTVLLLEAGDAEPIYSRVPSFYKYYRYNNNTDWMYKTKPSKRSCLHEGGQCKLPRGKVLGGTAIFNNMIYQRGHPYDCKNWFKSSGSNIQCEDLDSFYRKFENYQGHDENRKIYGTTGPMPFSQFWHKPFMAHKILIAANEIGLRYISNVINRNTLSGGFGFAYTFSAGGQRYTAARTYLHPNKSNLLIVLKAHVNKILLDSNERAYQVEYIIDQNWTDLHYVRARKEIILSAGTFNSPKILMLSGIGPQAELLKQNIELRKDLPVGQNLQSHYGFRMQYAFGYHADHKKEVNWPSMNVLRWTFLWFNAMTYLEATSLMKLYYYSDLLSVDNLVRYVTYGGGPLSSTGLAQLVGMLTSNFTKNKNKPDIQILFSGLQADCSRTDQEDLTRPYYYYPKHPGNTVYGGAAKTQFNETPYGIRRVNVDKEVFQGRKIDVYIILLNPRSAGNMTLGGNDPKLDPIIDPNYLEDEDDVAMLIEGGKIVDKLFLSKTMEELQMEMPLNYFRLCGTAERYLPLYAPIVRQGGYFYHIPDRNLDDKFFTCLMERYTVGEFHQQGTASIGKVVNENFQVMGVSGLRVVDGSVIPSTLSGAPQATIMMLAEKAVDVIIEELMTGEV